ncbi:MAG TPA: Fic/DOC family N-terminal domain-containing protein [bacterium]
MKPAIPKKLPLASLGWGDLIPPIAAANRALALYEGILHGVPEPQVLLSPLTTNEAVLSSRIEGTRATLNEVLEFEAGAEIVEESKRQDIQEIINYRRALRRAEEELVGRPFNLNLLKELHDILLDSVRGRNREPGRFRTTQNYIGARNAPIEQAAFIPPEPGLLLECLDNWERYYHAEERDALVQLAIVHAQFEIIHPFSDGNGRIGRILVPLFLYERKILSRPMFYLSGYLEEHRDEYIAHLRALNGPESWNRWVRFFLGALVEQARENADKARGILALYERLKVQVLGLTHSQYAIPLLDRLFRQPVFSSSSVTGAAAMPSKPMVMNLLRKLREAGILTVVREGSGRRPQILALAELVNLCEGKPVFRM